MIQINVQKGLRENIPIYSLYTGTKKHDYYSASSGYTDHKRFSHRKLGFLGELILGKVLEEAG